jgi:NitT/TauT family transport system permease protein
VYQVKTSSSGHSPAESAKRKWLRIAAVAAFWLIIWEVAALGLHDVILVSPRAVLVRLVALAGTGDYWRAIGTSAGRILGGFGIGFAAGVVFAVLSHLSKIIRALVKPAMDVVNAVPIVSFVVLAILAFGSQRLTVFVVAITIAPIIFYNTYEGIAAADPELLQMAKILRAPRLKIWRYIYMKAAVPFIFSAVHVGLGFAWKSGAAAELIGAARGTIGGGLHVARINLLTADVFAWTITILILSWLTQRLVKAVGAWQLK